MDQLTEEQKKKLKALNKKVLKRSFFEGLRLGALLTLLSALNLALYVFIIQSKGFLQFMTFASVAIVFYNVSKSQREQIEEAEKERKEILKQ